MYSAYSQSARLANRATHLTNLPNARQLANRAAQITNNWQVRFWLNALRVLTILGTKIFNKNK